MNFSGQFQSSASDFLKDSINEKYSYNFSWMGRPIIQYPQDLVAVQEIIWDVKPDLIIETGVAHGGSAVFFASLLELNVQCGGPKDAEVWCVEIDLRAHNREALVAHPIFPRLRIFDGSSVDVKIAVDMVCLACDKKAKEIILGSSDSDLQPAINEVRNRKISCLYLGFENQPNKGLTFTTNKTILIRNSEVLEYAR